jgi:hypothetical protein
MNFVTCYAIAVYVVCFCCLLSLSVSQPMYPPLLVLVAPAPVLLLAVPSNVLAKAINPRGNVWSKRRTYSAPMMWTKAAVVLPLGNAVCDCPHVQIALECLPLPLGLLPVPPTPATTVPIAGEDTTTDQYPSLLVGVMMPSLHLLPSSSCLLKSHIFSRVRFRAETICRSDIQLASQQLPLVLAAERGSSGVGQLNLDTAPTWRVVVIAPTK